MKKLIALTFFAALCGCAAAPKAPVDRRVTLAPDVDGDVYVTDIRFGTQNGSIPAMQANVVNNCSKQYGVQWKVQWLDADGMEIDTVLSSWDAVVLQPYEVKGLKCSAPKSDTADFRLYIRRDR